MHYYWRAVGGTGKPQHVEVGPNQMVFTGPRVEHWTVFPRETVLVSVSSLLRTHEQHEADLVRVPWYR
jgi:mannose-6-phosphate isomerase-like protein (cupin superfamily)